MRNIILSVLLIGLLSCGSNDKAIEQKLPQLEGESRPKQDIESEFVDTQKVIPKQTGEQNKSVIPANSIRMNIFKNTDISGYGYDILMGDKLYIHQPNIPALAGNNGFETEEAARRVAELVIFKIKNNIMPPTIEIKELDSLGVIRMKD